MFVIQLIFTDCCVANFLTLIAKTVLIIDFWENFYLVNTLPSSCHHITYALCGRRHSEQVTHVLSPHAQKIAFI